MKDQFAEELKRSEKNSKKWLIGTGIATAVAGLYFLVNSFFPLQDLQIKLNQHFQKQKPAAVQILEKTDYLNLSALNKRVDFNSMMEQSPLEAKTIEDYAMTGKPLLRFKMLTGELEVYLPDGEGNFNLAETYTNISFGSPGHQSAIGPTFVNGVNRHGGKIVAWNKAFKKRIRAGEVSIDDMVLIDLEHNHRSNPSFGRDDLLSNDDSLSTLLNTGYSFALHSMAADVKYDANGKKHVLWKQVPRGNYHSLGCTEVPESVLDKLADKYGVDVGTIVLNDYNLISLDEGTMEIRFNENVYNLDFSRDLLRDYALNSLIEQGVNPKALDEKAFDEMIDTAYSIYHGNIEDARLQKAEDKYALSRSRGPAAVVYQQSLYDVAIHSAERNIQ